MNEFHEEQTNCYYLLGNETPGGFQSKFLSKETVNSSINSLNEVFIEWFLFDSSAEQSINEFLESAKIDDFLTEKDFNDLIQGTANLTPEFISLIHKLLPFEINELKLQILNNESRSNKNYQRTIVPDAETVRKKLRSKYVEKKNARLEYLKEYGRNHRAENNIAQAKYRENNPNKVKESNNKWKTKNPEKAKETRSRANKKYAESHPEKIIAKSKEYYANNKELIKAKQRQRRKDNPEWAKEFDKKHYLKRKLKKTGPVISSILGALITSKQK